MGGVGSGLKFSHQDIERVLWVLALQGGTVTAAHRILTAEGIDISEGTIQKWKNERHAERYLEICEKAQAEITQRIAVQAEAIMVKAGSLEEQLIEEMHTALANGDLAAKDLAGALRNVSTTKALNNDKIAAPIRGRPSQITEHRSADQILAKLQALGVVDSTAEEIPELPAVP